MVGLNTVFKQVFGEGLKEYGFVKIKGKHPYLVRVVGDEIIHVITCRNVWCRDRGYKAIEILGCWESVYRKQTDFSESPNQVIDSLLTMGEFYKMTHFEDYNREYMSGLDQIKYRKEDEQSLREAMNEALKESIKNMVSVFDRINSLETYIQYRDLFLKPLRFNEEEGEINVSECTEVLIYIQTDYHGNFTEEYQKMFERSIYWDKSPLYVERTRKVYEEGRKRKVSCLNRIYSNPEIHKAALEELKKRKARNIEALRSYGLNV